MYNSREQYASENQNTMIFFSMTPNIFKPNSINNPDETGEALNLQSDEDKINNDNHNHNGGENDLKLSDDNSDNDKDNVNDKGEKG